MTDSSIIQQARDVLAKWSEGSFDGRWLHTIADRDSVAPGERVLQFDSFRDEDARLIVGTAGNPALWEALDTAFVKALTVIELFPGGAVSAAFQPIAAAIVAADEQMTYPERASS